MTSRDRTHYICVMSRRGGAGREACDRARARTRRVTLPPCASTIAVTRLRPRPRPRSRAAAVATIEPLPDSRAVVGGRCRGRCPTTTTSRAAPSTRLTVTRPPAACTSRRCRSGSRRPAKPRGSPRRRHTILGRRSSSVSPFSSATSAYRSAASRRPRQARPVSRAASSRRSRPRRCPSARRAASSPGRILRGSRRAPRDTPRGRRRLQRRLRRAAQARQRRAQVVRDVVERPAHAGHQRLDAIEHPVDMSAERVERIARPADGDARAGSTRFEESAEWCASDRAAGAAPRASAQSAQRTRAARERQTARRRCRGSDRAPRRAAPCCAQPGRGCRRPAARRPTSRSAPPAAEPLICAAAEGGTARRSTSNALQSAGMLSMRLRPARNHATSRLVAAGGAVGRDERVEHRDAACRIGVE